MSCWTAAGIEFLLSLSEAKSSLQMSASMQLSRLLSSSPLSSQHGSTLLDLLEPLSYRVVVSCSLSQRGKLLAQLDVASTANGQDSYNYIAKVNCWVVPVYKLMNQLVNISIVVTISDTLL